MYVCMYLYLQSESKDLRIRSTNGISPSPGVGEN